MGVHGLLSAMRGSMTKCNIREFSGSTVAIDASHWLYRGAAPHALKICTGVETTAYVKYIMKFVRVLVRNGVTPVVVLDGRDLPAKQELNMKRRQEREQNRLIGLNLLAQERKEEALQYFKRGISRNYKMTVALVKALRVKRIDYMIAPYEADAQLAYLAINGFVDYVLTNDSDLIVYGCPRIIFRMDHFGNGDLFLSETLPDYLRMPRESFDLKLFRWMCILTGCDYLPSLAKMGFRDAKKIVYGKAHRNVEEMLKSIPEMTNSKIRVNDKYIQGFKQAENVYLYQLVYDTRLRRVLPLNPYRDGIRSKHVRYAGGYESNKIMSELVIGNVDFDTVKIVDDLVDPILLGYGRSSIWWNGTEGKAPLVKVRIEDKVEESVHVEVELGGGRVNSKNVRLRTHGDSSIKDGINGARGNSATKSMTACNDMKEEECSIIAQRILDASLRMFGYAT